MPAEIVASLARRGVHAAMSCAEKMKAHQLAAAPSNAREAMQNLLNRLKSPESVVIFAVTAFIFIVLTSALEYAVRIVALNLAIVESTETTTPQIKLPVGKVDDEMAKEPLLDDYDEEVEERSGELAKPITISLRSTFRHLRSVGGFWARWRGLLHGIFYSVAFSAFNVIFTAFFSFFPVLGFAIGRVGAAVITCNLHAAWTHATIATPTEKPFFQRFLDRKTARHLMLPTIRYQVGLLALQFGTCTTASLSHRILERHGVNFLTLNSILIPIIFFFGMILVHVVPSLIALTRAEASLLPEDRSAVVPFDRNFGGRIGWDFPSRKAYFFHNISMRGAYMTFDKQTYKRVIKIFVKLFAYMTAISVIFMGLFIAEFFALAGQEFSQVERFVKAENGGLTFIYY